MGGPGQQDCQGNEGNAGHADDDTGQRLSKPPQAWGCCLSFAADWRKKWISSPKMSRHFASLHPVNLRLGITSVRRVCPAAIGDFPSFIFRPGQTRC